MKNLISISTGLIYKFTPDRNKMIKMLQSFHPDGIEISFADPELLFNFQITNDNINYLKDLPYVTLHGPWKNIRYNNNQICLKTLQTLEDLYAKIGAKNITIEPMEIDDYTVFDNYNFKVSTENSDYRKLYKTPSEIESILKNNPKLSLTFDFAHALTVPDSIDRFLDAKKLQQVHLSYYNYKLSDHSFLHKNSSKVIIEKIKKIPINIPLVLECVAEKPEQIDWIAEEIKFLKSI